MKNWQPWSWLYAKDEAEEMQLEKMLNFRRGNPFPVSFDRFDDDKHGPGPRQPSAAIHPEQQ